MMRTTIESNTAGLVDALRNAIDGEVDDSVRRRAEYSSDASNYRVTPQVVVFPRSTEDAAAALAVALERSVPTTTRGGGTSIAGNSIGSGVVIDFSRHVNKILEIDADAHTARIEPGVVMSVFQKAAAPFGLRFGPDPSTQNRATFGGMLGNNACGPHAVAYGRTVDNVLDLDVIDGLGRRYRASTGDRTFANVPGLADLVGANLGILRTEFGRFGRQVSGYSLEHLLPENGSNLARSLVGTEGSTVSILGATIKLVPIPGAATLVVLGYRDMATAADNVPALLALRPLAIEGLDARLIDVVRHQRGDASIPALPTGGGWMMVEVGGESVEMSMERAEAIVAVSGSESTRIITAGKEAAAMWRIRADGAGLSGRTPSGAQAWPGWEDAAVPPERLGDYLREFESLMADYGVDGIPYGHFGDGCVHARIDIPLEKSGDVLRAFVTDAASLVVKYGGSLSGEHGDGRARSELLPLMYSPKAIDLFGQFKALFDPHNLLNPGIIAKPAPLDLNLRRPKALPLLARGGFSFTHDGGDFTKAVHRCVGVGKCRADSRESGGFMCPSYLATRDEKDSTRGRARVLQEMINGSLVTASWKSPEVHDALDLCLSCKACSSDCPAGVDMAQYKSEVLHNTYKGKLRPINHYVLGWLPRWARLAGIAPGIVNAILAVPFISKLVLTLGGMDARRSMPAFAPVPFRRWWKKHSEGLSGESRRPKVVLWTDSFSDSFSPTIPQAALSVLKRAGYDVIIPEAKACCGLTWISTGQLDGARRQLENLLAVLGPFAVNGIPIVGLEPSCTAVLRSDLLDLFPGDHRATMVAKATRTLAELLTDPHTAPSAESGWKLPDLSGVNAIVQPHCHQHSVMGFDADAKLLRDSGATITTLAGCCGLAGNFGMEKGHYGVSVAVAENALLPALRNAKGGDIFLADGFSCRTQADDLLGVKGVALAQLLAEHL